MTAFQSCQGVWHYSLVFRVVLKIKAQTNYWNKFSCFFLSFFSFFIRYQFWDITITLRWMISFYCFILTIATFIYMNHFYDSDLKIWFFYYVLCTILVESKFFVEVVFAFILVSLFTGFYVAFISVPFIIDMPAFASISVLTESCLNIFTY